MIRYSRISVFIIFMFMLSIICFSCSSQTDDITAVIDLDTEEKILEVISEGELPSMQIAIIDQGRLAWSKALGQDTSTDHVYMNGSVQKVFDAVAVLQLYERGLLDLEANINDYLPFAVQHPDYPDMPITIHMLLSHRSGLDMLDYQFAWDTECLAYPEFRPVCSQQALEMSLEEFLIASFTPQGTNFNPAVWVNKPGDSYHYSVSAYPLLRYLIETVSGISYPQYMRENLFEPLGMHNSGFTDEEFISHTALPHTRVNGKNITLDVWNGNGYMMRSTAEDMAVFMLALMNDGAYNSYQLLQPETIDLMQTKASRGRSPFNPNSELFDPGYGLGIIHYSHGWLGHGGSTVGYQTLFQFKPSKQTGFVIFTNINGILGDKDDFQSIWQKVAAVRDLLLSKTDPLATVDLPKEILPYLSALTVIIIIIINYRKARKPKGVTPKSE